MDRRIAVELCLFAEQYLWTDPQHHQQQQHPTPYPESRGMDRRIAVEIR
jgi:hypothetical protein